MVHDVCCKLREAGIAHDSHHKEGRTALCLVSETHESERELCRVHDRHEERYSKHRVKTYHSSEGHDHSAESHIDDCIYRKHVLRLELDHERGTDPSSEQEGEHV